ncbi:NUDIX hydrolase [Dethiothermospora halolimnae]|uniref:NUDIX hydrolase n=1 Tax=Dethiothermospora halolimnae TaxID=3114390 RepID=UPI003CCBE7EF
MKEIFAKPGVAGIIEKTVKGIDYILIQERFKEDAPLEKGLIEIPSGKIREFENLYECLKREIMEETGLQVLEIEGEQDAVVFESNGYKVLNYTPFSSSQNIQGTYPIMVQTFICKVKGQTLSETNETKNIRWISLNDLKKLLDENINKFYPMHVITLKKYIKIKLGT